MTSRKAAMERAEINLKYAQYVDDVSTIKTKTMHPGRKLRPVSFWVPPEMLPETEINWCEPLRSPKPKQRAAVCSFKEVDKNDPTKKSSVSCSNCDANPNSAEFQTNTEKAHQYWREL